MSIDNYGKVFELKEMNSADSYPTVKLPILMRITLQQPLQSMILQNGRSAGSFHGFLHDIFSGTVYPSGSRYDLSSDKADH